MTEIQFSKVQDPDSFAVERCTWVPRWPDDETRCPNEAKGVIRLKLHAAPTIQKRYGKRVMLQMVMGFHVCPKCFPAVSVMKITDEKLRATLNRFAQQRNSGILVDWSQTELEHVPYDDPEYLLLVNSRKKDDAANDSQPAPAGPLAD